MQTKSHGDEQRAALPQHAPVGARAEKLEQPRAVLRYRLHDIIVIEEPLRADEWALVRRFLLMIAREDLRARFGHAFDIKDEATLRRLFDITPGLEQMSWLLDGHGQVAAIAQRVMLAPGEAEVALIVRSDLKRLGIGEFLLRDMLHRSASDGFPTLGAVVTRDNRAMLRLAAKIGYAVRTANALALEIVFRNVEAAA